MENEEHSGESEIHRTQEGQAKLMQMEQSLEQLTMQKKQFQSQLIEAESASDAIKNEQEAYKMIGNLMVKQSSVELSKELKEKQEILKVRIATIEKQEDKIRSEVKTVQEELLKKIAQQKTVGPENSKKEKKK